MKAITHLCCILTIISTCWLLNGCSKTDNVQDSISAKRDNSRTDTTHNNATTPITPTNTLYVHTILGDAGWPGVDEGNPALGHGFCSNLSGGVILCAKTADTYSIYDVDTNGTAVRIAVVNADGTGTVKDGYALRFVTESGIFGQANQDTIRIQSVAIDKKRNIYVSQSPICASQDGIYVGTRMGVTRIAYSGAISVVFSGTPVDKVLCSRDDVLYVMNSKSIAKVDGRQLITVYEAPQNSIVDFAYNEANKRIVVLTFNELLEVSGGTVNTVMKSARTQGWHDGPIAEAQFDKIIAIACGSMGEIFAADCGTEVGRSVVRKIDTRRIEPGKNAGNTRLNAVPEIPPAILASTVQTIKLPSALSVGRGRYPMAMTVDRKKNVYLVIGNGSQGGFHVYRVDNAGSVLELTSPNSGVEKFQCRPMGIAVNPSTGEIIVSDSALSTLLILQPEGTLQLYAGECFQSGYMDGNPEVARFSSPAGIVFDHLGNLLVADYGNSVIRSVSKDGTVSTVAGMAHVPGALDGLGAACRLRTTIMSASNKGTILGDGKQLRFLTPKKSVVTMAGSSDAQDIADGGWQQARFSDITGVAECSPNGILVLDKNTLRYVSSEGGVKTLKAMKGGVQFEQVEGTYSFGDWCPSNPSLMADADKSVYILDGKWLHIITIKD